MHTQTHIHTHTNIKHNKKKKTIWNICKLKCCLGVMWITRVMCTRVICGALCHSISKCYLYLQKVFNYVINMRYVWRVQGCLNGGYLKHETIQDHYFSGLNTSRVNVIQTKAYRLCSGKYHSSPCSNSARFQIIERWLLIIIQFYAEDDLWLCMHFTTHCQRDSIPLYNKCFL